MGEGEGGRGRGGEGNGEWTVSHNRRSSLHLTCLTVLDEDLAECPDCLDVQFTWQRECLF